MPGKFSKDQRPKNPVIVDSKYAPLPPEMPSDPRGLRPKTIMMGGAAREKFYEQLRRLR